LPQATQRAKQFRVITNLPTQLAGARIGQLHFRRGIAARGGRRGAPG
jgi:hypothetical protein